MQEKKLEEQEKVLRNVTERYLELDIKYTELMHEHKLVQDENAKLREHILKLEGADKGAKETTQKDDDYNITIKIPATNGGESTQITFKMSDIKCMVPLNENS